MNKIPFTKYHGAGNDFILIDDRQGQWGSLITEPWVAHVCHRRFGIGADGLILLQEGKEGADFFMKYYNSDGRTSSFCGNGGRCIVAFAAQLHIHANSFKFLGTDGWHSANLNADGIVSLTMTEVNEVKKIDAFTYTLNTGSPHYVTFVDDVNSLDVRTLGRDIRNSPPFKQEGINVNFVQQIGPSEIRIRTYERGVEDETMACGTGVVAAAIADAVHANNGTEKVIVHAAGGKLVVEFSKEGPQQFTNIKLIGPAVEVFQGMVEIG